MTCRLTHPLTPVPPGDTADWLVLGCTPACTLTYEEALTTLYDVRVWTPATYVSRRLPRRRGRVWTLTPILPGMLFLDIRDVDKFMEIGFPYGVEGYPFPRCSIRLLPVRRWWNEPTDPAPFHAVAVPDRFVEHLRSEDDRKVPEDYTLPEQEARFSVGDKVVVISGPLENLGFEWVVEEKMAGGGLRLAGNKSPIPVVVRGSHVAPAPV